jgi:hypothetical protein
VLHGHRRRLPGRHRMTGLNHPGVVHRDHSHGKGT